MYSMLHKFKMFQKANKIYIGDPIYYDDSRWANELGCCKKTVKRAREYWQDRAVIRFEKGKGRSKPTRYWLIGDPKPILNDKIKKDDKLSTFNCRKQDNLSSKDDNKDSKSGQNVKSPIYINKDINKDINKLTNHLYLPTSVFIEVYIEQFGKDIYQTKEYFSGQGYTECQIEEAFKKSGKKPPNSH